MTTGFGGDRQGRQGIHITDISQFRECRFRWDIQSHLRRNLEPKRFTAPLWLGTGIHEALADYYGKGYDLVASFLNWADHSVEDMRRLTPDLDIGQIDEQIDLGTGMLVHYMTWAPEHDDFEVIAVEDRFFIEHFVLGQPLEGRGDMIIRRGGRLWIMEHKTAAQHDTERLVLEQQPGAYQMAMQTKYDEPIVGTYYNFLRKKVPSVPKLLVNGTLSLNKQIDTTRARYLQEIQDQGLMRFMDDYVEFLDYLDAKQEEHPFFYREEVVRNIRNLKILWKDLQNTGREMLDPNIAIYPSPNILKCKMCNVQGACITYHDGGDFEFVLKETMVEREEDYSREGDKEEEIEWAL